jgi:hypothetical protein
VHGLVTPLCIEIEYARSVPLRLRYSSRSLQSDDGQRSVTLK